MFYALLLLALAASASEAYRCCVPTLWEANEGVLMLSVVQGMGSVEEEFTRVSYNGNQKMIAVVYLSNGPNHNKRIIQDFPQMTQYSIQGNVCTKYILSEPWDPYCIADNATVLHDTYYGTPENRLDVQTFRTSRVGFSGYFTLTKRECVPVALSLTGTVSGVDNLWTFGISNFTMGIQDPSVFNVPDICMKTTTTDHSSSLGKVRRSFVQLPYSSSNLNASLMCEMFFKKE